MSLEAIFGSDFQGPFIRRGLSLKSEAQSQAELGLNPA